MLGYASARFISSPMTASLSDIYKRRPLLLIMDFAQHIELLFIAWIFSGIFGATFATTNLCIANTSPKEKRTVNFSIISSAFGLGLMIDPSLGGFIGEYFGTRAPLFFASGVSAINLLLGYIFLTETMEFKIQRKIFWNKLAPFGILKRIRLSSIPIQFLYAFFLLQLAFHSRTTTCTYDMIVKFNWSFSRIGWSLMEVGRKNVLVQGEVNRILIPKIGERKSIILETSFFIGNSSNYFYDSSLYSI